MKQNIILYLTIIILIFNACEKEYFPDEDAYRDPKLFGTWITIDQVDVNYPTLEVYSEDGYCGGTTKYIKDGLQYQAIDGIWYVEKAKNDNNLKYNRIKEQKRFRKGMYNHTIDYYFTEKYDTLFCRYEYYSANTWDTLVKYKYQLIYDGPEFVNIDSTSNNNN